MTRIALWTYPLNKVRDFCPPSDSALEMPLTAIVPKSFPGTSPGRVRGPTVAITNGERVPGWSLEERHGLRRSFAGHLSDFEPIFWLGRSAQPISFTPSHKLYANGLIVPKGRGPTMTSKIVR